MTLTLLLHDDEAALPSAKGIEVVRDPTAAAAQRATRLFVWVAATRLQEVAERVLAANRSHALRALMVRDDVGANWITVSLAEAGLRSLRNLVVHSDSAVPRRILSGWRLGAQARLIADAAVVGRKLWVRGCDLRAYEIPVDQVAALRGLSAASLSTFEVHPNGAFLHWPEADVHLDLDGLRAVVDPAWGEKARAERLAHDKRFGEGVRRVRLSHGLSQGAIHGLSERQVRRIEAGEVFPHSSTLEKLALAHGMAVGVWLEAVAEAAVAV